MSVHQLPDGRWICKWSEGGKQRKEYFGRGPGAEDAAKARNAELGVGVAKKALATPTLLDLANGYLERKLVTMSDDSYRKAMNKIEKFTSILGEKQVGQITHDTVDGYVATRRADGVKFTTISGELTYLKAILNAAVERDLIISNPVARYKRPKCDDARIRPPSGAEFDAILEQAGPHLKRMMLVCRYTGIRPGPVEALGLRWEDCDFFAGVIMVRSAEKGGARTRNVPISPKLLPMLKQWQYEDAAMRMPWIIHFGGKRVFDIMHAWKIAKAKAGVTRRIRLYDLRHMAASALLAGGASVGTVAKILGNTPVMVLRHYEHVMDQQAIDAISKL